MARLIRTNSHAPVSHRDTHHRPVRDDEDAGHGRQEEEREDTLRLKDLQRGLVNPALLSRSAEERRVHRLSQRAQAVPAGGAGGAAWGIANLFPQSHRGPT